MGAIHSSFSSSSSSSSSSVVGCYNKEKEEMPSMGKCCSSSRWSNLPDDILEMILKRLGLVDSIRVSAVCKSWRCLSDKNKKQQLPLLLSWGAPPLEIRSFYNLFDSTTCRPTMPSDYNGKMSFCGCSHGWWIMSSFSDRGVYLWDPNGRREIQLPAFAMSSSIDDIEYSPDYLYKAVLSCAPATNAEDCIVVAKININFEGTKLAFCRPTDREWTLFPDLPEWDFFEDMMFFKGKCYAISRTIMDGYRIVVCDIGGNNRPPQTNALYHLKEKLPARVVIDGRTKFYLVECRGELLLVIRPRPQGSKHVSPIELFRVDFGANKLVKVESLGEDSALFLSSIRNQWSLSSARIFGGKGNCIYYINEDDDHLGVLDLSTGIHTFFPTNFDLPHFSYFSHQWVSTDPW